MKKIIVPAVIITIMLTVCLAAYAQSSVFDKLKQIIEPDKPIDIGINNIDIASGVSSLVTELADGVVKIKNSVEDEIRREAELIAGEGAGGVTDMIEEGLPKVIDGLKKAVETTPTDVKLLIKLAVAYKLGGEYSLALTVAEKILTYDPDNEDAALVKAECLKLKGEAEKGIQFLQGFAEEKVNDPKLKTQLATLRMETGDIETAEKDIETAIGTDPRMPELYNKLGEILAKGNKKQIRLYVEGKRVDFGRYSNVEPVIKNGSTLIPIRALADNINAQIEYDAATATVKVKTGEKEILLIKNNKTAKVNAKGVEMSEPAREINGRILIPLRFISEQLGKEVIWYPYSKYGIISVNEKVE